MRWRTLCGLIGLVGLAACQAPSSADPTPTSADVVPSETAQLSPAPTATLAETLGPTNTPPIRTYQATPANQVTPDILHSPISKNLLLSGDEACELPCWYGLKVGDSDVEDIQKAFRQSLGVSDDYIFIMGEDPSLGTNSGYVNFGWKSPQQSGKDPELFSIGTYFNPQSDILSDINVYTTLPSFLDSTKPQQVMSELGAPSEIRVFFQINMERTTTASLDTLFVYPDKKTDSSFVLGWRQYIPVNITGFPTSPRVAKWCLSGIANQTTASFFLQVPRSNDPRAIASIQNDYAPIESMFGVTPEELYQRVTQEDNTCISHEF